LAPIWFGGCWLSGDGRNTGRKSDEIPDLERHWAHKVHAKGLENLADHGDPDFGPAARHKLENRRRNQERFERRSHGRPTIALSLLKSPTASGARI
jgi:hypothetical protein